MGRIRQMLAEMIAETIDVSVQASDIELPDMDHGDYAYPVMKAASQTEDDPRSLASDIAGQIEQNELITSVSVAGPGYLNIRLDRELFANEVDGLLERDAMGVNQHDGTILVEFSSPNVAKPMHVGHLRNNVLGDAIQRILRFVGYDVTSENYLGDWGTQYGKLIYAFKQYGSMDSFEKQPMEHMYDLYVRFHEEMEEDADMKTMGREWAAKVEAGDEEAVALWEMFRRASIAYHKEDYRRIGITFDRWTGESTVVEGARSLIEKWVETGEMERDADGSVFYEFDDTDVPGMVLLKADGSTLYSTRDLYNLKKRNDEGFDENLYVVGAEQELHFKQVFTAAAELGLDIEGAEHISYGLLSLPEGSMSSRKGRIIRLEDAIDEAVLRARQKAEEKIGRDIANAESIGISALKYANLSVSRTKNVEFAWDEALSFEGDSGPYLQYANTRAKSILRKTEENGAMIGDADLRGHQLIRELSRFPWIVEQAAREREPVCLVSYLSELCECFNTFYHSCPVLDTEGDTLKRRLRIVELFAAVTDRGMALLGIEPLEQM